MRYSDNQILFAEKQRFKQWWVWIILIGINLIFLWGIWQQVIQGVSFGNNPMSDTGLIIVFALVFLFTLFFLSIRLETQIRGDGIYVRFFPFYRQYKYFRWNQIAHIEVGQYKPVQQFGGWGFRGAKKNRVLSMSGNKGLQLEFADGSRLLIGTIKASEMKDILIKMGKLH